jgi:hypothetical protein
MKSSGLEQLIPRDLKPHILSIKGDIFSGSNFVTADVKDSKQ